PASRLPVQYYIAFFRHDFTISDISKITSLTMYIKYDENPTVYINGTEVWSAEGYIDSRYVEIDLTDKVGLLNAGKNTVQVQISNVYGGAIFDMALICLDAFTAILPICSDWEYIYYERVDTEIGSGVETPAPDGWLDGSDSADWEVGPAPFAGSAWPNAISATHFSVGYFDAYLRTTFTLDSVDGINSMFMQIIYDEDPVVYLNGTQIYKVNGHKDSGYQMIYLNDKIDLLKEGENILCVYFRNKPGGGGSVFDMGLYYDADVKEVHDFTVLPTVSEWSYISYERVESGSGVETPAPEGWLDGTDTASWSTGPAPFSGTAWTNTRAQTVLPYGYFDAYLRTTFKIKDLSKVQSLYLEVIYDEDPVIYINGTEVWSAVGYKDSGYQTIKINDAIPSLKAGENTVCVYFRNKVNAGGSVFDMGLYYNDEPVVEQYYDDNGYIIPAGATCANVSSFGDINKAENILDNDQNTVCGSGGAGTSGQTFIVNFKKAEEVSEIYLQCKREQNTDGQYGTYNVYDLLNGEEALIAEGVPAIIAADGGCTLKLDRPVPATGIKVVVASWEGPGWACLADISVKATKNAPADAHTWGEWTVTEAANCTEAGVATRVCTACGVKQFDTTPAVPDAHVWEVVESTPATRTEQGETVYACTKCGVSRTEILPYLTEIFVEKKQTFMYENGQMVKGWKEIGGKQVYFFVSTGVMNVYPAADIDGKSYTFEAFEYEGLTLYAATENVPPVKNGLYKENDGIRFYEDGVAFTGWKEIGGKQVYFFKSTGLMNKYATAKIGGKTYTFEAFTYEGLTLFAGTEKVETPVVKNGLVKEPDGVRCYENGVMKTGWVEIDGNRLYFKASNGLMNRYAVIIIGGVTYNFTAYDTFEGVKLWKEA
ncbi:MAG: hypothetical protein IJU52_04360, partial [Clostridia bacterium]|nr:hypothetical protein [Clostridia bacterium]